MRLVSIHIRGNSVQIISPTQRNDLDSNDWAVNVLFRTPVEDSKKIDGSKLLLFVCFLTRAPIRSLYCTFCTEQRDLRNIRHYAGWQRGLFGIENPFRFQCPEAHQGITASVSYVWYGTNYIQNKQAVPYPESRTNMQVNNTQTASQSTALQLNMHSSRKHQAVRSTAKAAGRRSVESCRRP